MFFADRLTLDKPRRTTDGYMAVRARAARSGVYQYLGSEVDPKGERFAADQIVNVYRPTDEVFAESSVASFLLKPITDDHPAEAVTADNWKSHAKGIVGKVLRDGEHLAFDLVLMDAGLIAAVDSGKRELSNGYGCTMSFEDGTAPDGTEYQAIQRDIRGNHVAVVEQGRAGSTCRIGDAAPCDAIPSAEVEKLIADERTYSRDGDGDKNDPTRREAGGPGGGGSPTQDGDFSMTKLTIDGLIVDLSDADAVKAAFTKKDAAMADAVAAKDKAETDLAAAQTSIAAKDTEIADLKAKLEDAEITPAKLRDAAKVYGDTAAKAKALGVTHDEDADVDAIMKTVVAAKMGDAAKDWTDAQIAASFAVLTKDAKADDKGGQKLADALADAHPKNDKKQVSDAYADMVDHLTTAWKKPSPAAAA